MYTRCIFHSRGSRSTTSDCNSRSDHCRENPHQVGLGSRQERAGYPHVIQGAKQDNRQYGRTYEHCLLKVDADLAKVAEHLVNIRRARIEADSERWRKTCYHQWYQCRRSQCPRGEKEYSTRELLEKHFLDKHHDTFSMTPSGVQELEVALEECRIVVQ